MKNEDGPCFYCGEMTSSLAGDPGKWPLIFSQPDGTGIARFHHSRCVVDRLPAPAQGAANPLREALVRARKWMMLDDTYGDAQEFQDDLELVDAAIMLIEGRPALPSTELGTLNEPQTVGLSRDDAQSMVFDLLDAALDFDRAGAGLRKRAREYYEEMRDKVIESLTSPLSRPEKT